MNWEHHLDEYESHLISRDNSEVTVKKYKVNVKQMLDYIGKNPRDITQEDLNTYKVFLKRAYDVNSLGPMISAVNVFMAMLGKIEKLKSPPSQVKNVVPLTEGEIKKLFAVSEKNSTAYAIITTLYYGMLRNAELCNLNISDIDFVRGKIRVNNGKGGINSEINLHPAALAAIQRYLEKGRITPISEPDALFITVSGNRMSRTPLTKLVKEWATKTGITKRVYPHIFRHSAISHMSDNGATIQEIQRQSRHKNIDSLMVYVHPSEAKVRDTYLKTVTSYDVPIEEKKEESLPETQKTQIEIKTNGSKSPVDKLTDLYAEGIMPLEGYLAALEKLAKLGYKNE